MTEARLRVVLPLAVVAGGVVLAGALVALRGSVEPQAPEVQAPLVRVLTVRPEDVRFTVRTHGSVEPRAGRLCRTEEENPDRGIWNHLQQRARRYGR
jgi:multidrug efflux pump subunit AcrA (membrane-fusion protein)